MKRLFIHRFLLWSLPWLLLIGYASTASASIMIKMGSDFHVEPEAKTGSILSLGGQVTVEGTVEGDVTVIGNSLVLGREALITGNATSFGGIIVKGRGARILGNQTEINSSNLLSSITTVLNEEWEGWSWIFAIVQVSLFMCLVIVALIIVILIPGPIDNIASTINNDVLKTSLWSILVVVTIVFIAVFLTISVIGIVLVPLELIIVVCAAFVGLIAMGRLTGQKMHRLLKKDGKGIVRETFWGLLALFLIGWIPYVGTIVKILTVFLGLGGVCYSRFGTRMALNQKDNLIP